MFAIVLGLFGIQVTLAGVVFALTSGAQAAVVCAIVGVLIELVAVSRGEASRPPTA